MTSFASAGQDSESYAYLYGRVSGMMGKILSRREIESLIQAQSGAEALASLEATDYEPYLSGMKPEGYTAVEIQERFMKYFRDLFYEIVDISPSKTGALFNGFYGGVWDHANKKTILRGMHHKSGFAKTRRLMIPVGSIILEDAEKLASLDSVRLFLEKTGALAGKEDESAYQSFEETGNLSLLESYLDKTFITGYVDSFADTAFRDYALLWADLMNVKNSLRCARYGIDATPYLVDEGLSISPETRKKAAKSRPEELEQVFSNTSYRRLVETALDRLKNEGTLSFIENLTDNYRMTYLIQKSSMQPLSVYPAAYLIEKKLREIKTLTGIILSKKEGFSPEETRKIISEG
ncbi:MAG: V-type ATPase subunit [Candidatus Altiarchaeota archaeon]